LSPHQLASFFDQLDEDGSETLSAKEILSIASWELRSGNFSELPFDFPGQGRAAVDAALAEVGANKALAPGRAAAAKRQVKGLDEVVKAAALSSKPPPRDGAPRKNGPASTPPPLPKGVSAWGSQPPGETSASGAPKSRGGGTRRESFQATGKPPPAPLSQRPAPRLSLAAQTAARKAAAKEKDARDGTRVSSDTGARGAYPAGWSPDSKDPYFASPPPVVRPPPAKR
jgi:hypothetical protein